MSTQSKPAIHALTGLRFFAAAGVVIYHFAPHAHGLHRHLILHGPIGVMVFFVLSGFILAYSYSLGPGLLRGDLRGFWIARFARLYPVYLLGVILFIPIILFWTQHPAWQRCLTVLLSLTVTQAWFHLMGLSWGMWNPPGWSLSAEAFFYLLFPVVCPPLSKLSARTLMAFTCTCWALAVLAIYAHDVLDSGLADYWSFVPLMRLPEFLIGVAVGLAWKNRKTAWFDRIAPYASGGAALTLFVTMCLPLQNVWFVKGALAPLAALLIAGLACNRGWLARTLSVRPIVVLGGASYSLYILHWPLWLIGQHYFAASRLARQQPNVYFIVYFIATAVAAYLCFRYLEEPANRYVRRKLMPARMEPSLATSSDLSPAASGPTQAGHA